MDELASSLGISKRTIYKNFKDKEEILLSLLVRLRDERKKIFTSLISDNNNVVEIFVKVIEIQQSTPICNVKFSRIYISIILKLTIIFRMMLIKTRHF